MTERKAPTDSEYMAAYDQREADRAQALLARVRATRPRRRQR